MSAPSDAGFMLPDRGPPVDSGETFVCDPINTGIFVAGVAYMGEDARRSFGVYDPRTNEYRELADIRSCIGAWYIRAMTVSRTGVAYFSLGNQTMAVYDIESGSCEVHPLALSDQDGFYSLATFIGDGSSSGTSAHERLLAVFTPFTESETEQLIEIDTTTFAETPSIQIHNGGGRLVSLVGTQDGRLFAGRYRFVDEINERDVIQIDRTDGSFHVVATAPSRDETWLRTAIALWDRRIFVFDASSMPTLQSTVSEIDRSAGTWRNSLLTMDQFQVEAVSTTTCVGVDLI